MRRTVAYLAGCAALVGFALGYALPGYAHLPNLYLDPVEGRFFVARSAGPVPMAWYGMLLYGAAGAALSAAVTAAVLVAVRARAVTDRAAVLGGAWALFALLLVGAWFTWNNWP